MVYSFKRPDVTQDTRKKPVSKLEKAVRSMHAPSIGLSFDYCPKCNLFTHLHYQKLFLGSIEITCSCCGDVVGYTDFPASVRKRWDRKVYLAWLNS